jgi:hypothetical protein
MWLLCGKGLVNTMSSRDKIIVTSAILGYKCVRCLSVQILQGNFTFHICFFPSPTLLFDFSLLPFYLGLLLLFLPPLCLLPHPLFLFPLDYWLPFKLVDDCIECTFAK